MSFWSVRSAHHQFPLLLVCLFYKALIRCVSGISSVGYVLFSLNFIDIFVIYFCGGGRGGGLVVCSSVSKISFLTLGAEPVWQNSLLQHGNASILAIKTGQLAFVMALNAGIDRVVYLPQCIKTLCIKTMGFLFESKTDGAPLRTSNDVGVGCVFHSIST